MPQDFNLFVDRRNTDSIKWAKYQDQDILPMWVADTDFVSPEPVLAALHARVDHGVFGYNLPPSALTDVLAARMHALYNWQIEPEWIVYLPGLVCALNITARAMTKYGDQVLVPKPVYPPFMSAISLAGCKQVDMPMRLQVNSGLPPRWLPAIDQFESQARDSTLMFLCNPHNPGGTVYRREELLTLQRIAQDNGLTVCSDEIHCDLLLDNSPHIPFASLNKDAEQRTITLMAPSKTFNIAGLGCSFAIIANPVLRKRFNRIREGIVPHVNLLGYTAALAAYREGQRWLEAQLDYLRDNRTLTETRINGIPGLSLAHIEATYLAWIDASTLHLNDTGQFFETRGVGMSPGADFGNRGFVRLNFGCRRELLEEALARIEKAVKNPG